MRQPQNLGNGRSAQDAAGCILCWLAMVALVAISFTGSLELTPTRTGTDLEGVGSSESPDMEIAVVGGSKSSEKAPGTGTSNDSATESQSQIGESTPQG